MHPVTSEEQTPKKGATEKEDESQALESNNLHTIKQLHEPRSGNLNVAALPNETSI